MPSYGPVPRGPRKPGDPAAPAAPSWDTEKPENRGESGNGHSFHAKQWCRQLTGKDTNPAECQKRKNKKVQKNLSRKNRVPGPKGTLPVDFSRSTGSGQTVEQATINLRGRPKSLLPEATSTPDPHPWGRPSCSFLLGPVGF